ERVRVQRDLLLPRRDRLHRRLERRVAEAESARGREREQQRREARLARVGKLVRVERTVLVSGEAAQAAAGVDGQQASIARPCPGLRAAPERQRRRERGE